MCVVVCVVRVFVCVCVLCVSGVCGVRIEWCVPVCCLCV